MIFSLRRSISLTGLKAFAISALMLVTTHVQPIQAIEMEFAAPGFSFKPKEVLIPNDKNDCNGFENRIQVPCKWDKFHFPY